MKKAMIVLSFALMMSPVFALAKSPVKSSTVPVGATAQCKDGTYTFTKTHKGACSHHKGVLKWL